MLDLGAGIKVSPVKLDVSEYLGSLVATVVCAVWDQVQHWASAPVLHRWEREGELDKTHFVIHNSYFSF